MNKSAQSKQGHQSEKKKRRNTYMRILRCCQCCCCCCCCCFVFFCFLLLLLSFGFCVSEDSQLTGRAHNEVKKMKPCSMMNLGFLVDLSGKKRGLSCVSSRSFKCGAKEKKEGAIYSFTHPSLCCASSQ